MRRSQVTRPVPKPMWQKSSFWLSIGGLLLLFIGIFFLWHRTQSQQPSISSSAPTRLTLTQPATALSPQVGQNLVYLDAQNNLHQVTGSKDVSQVTVPSGLFGLRWSPDLTHFLAQVPGDGDTVADSYQLFTTSTGDHQPLNATLASWVSNDQFITVSPQDTGTVLARQTIGESVESLTTVPGTVSDLAVNQSTGQVALLVASSADENGVTDLFIYNLKDSSLHQVASNIVRLIGWSSSGTLAYVHLDGSTSKLIFYDTAEHVQSTVLQGLAVWVGNTLVAISANDAHTLVFISLDGSVRSTKLSLSDPVDDLEPSGNQVVLVKSNGKVYRVTLPQ